MAIQPSPRLLVGHEAVEDCHRLKDGQTIRSNISGEV